MKRLYSSLVFLLVALCIFAQDYKWQNCENGKNFELSYLVKPSDRDFCIRAEFKIDASIKQVLTAVSKYENHSKWIYNCKKIELCSKNSERIIYRQITSVPFPYKDSEAYLELKIINSEESVVVIQNCIPDYQPLNSKYERITRYKSVWKITKLAENQTQIVWYAETGGPKGMSAIEKKMFLCYAPSKTIRNLTKYIPSN